MIHYVVPPIKDLNFALQHHLHLNRYDTGTNLLSNDTTTYPAVPNLPVPPQYPFTASTLLLPLEQPGYNPRILVVGGSPTDQADPVTDATPATYLLDFSIRPFVWQRENMASNRVMPDATLLPDGIAPPLTSAICNGGKGVHQKAHHGSRHCTRCLMPISKA